MDTPIVPLPPINRRIFEAIMETCREIVDDTPKSKELLGKANHAMLEIKGKVSRDTFDTVEDLFFAVSNLYGDEMFQWGFSIGRNPDTLFDLPDSEQDY